MLMLTAKCFSGGNRWDSFRLTLDFDTFRHVHTCTLGISVHRALEQKVSSCWKGGTCADFSHLFFPTFGRTRQRHLVASVTVSRPLLHLFPPLWRNVSVLIRLQQHGLSVCAAALRYASTQQAFSGVRTCVCVVVEAACAESVHVCSHGRLSADPPPCLSPLLHPCLRFHLTPPIHLFLLHPSFVFTLSLCLSPPTRGASSVTLYL